MKSLKDRRDKFNTEIRRKHHEVILNTRRMKFMDKNQDFSSNHFTSTNDYIFDKKWLEEAKSFIDSFKDLSAPKPIYQNSLETIKKFRVWLQTTSPDAKLINLFQNPNSIKAFHNLLKNCLQEFSLMHNVRELVYELTYVFVNLTGIQEQFSKISYEEGVQITMLNLLKEIVGRNEQQIESIGHIFMFLANLLQDCQVFKDYLSDQYIDQISFSSIELLKQVDPNQTTLETYGNIVYFISIFVSTLPHYSWNYYSTFLSVLLNAMKTDYEDIVQDAIFGVYSLLAIANPKQLDYFYKSEGTIQRILQLTLAKNNELKHRALMLLVDFSYSDLKDQSSF